MYEGKYFAIKLEADMQSTSKQPRQVFLLIERIPANATGTDLRIMPEHIYMRFPWPLLVFQPKCGAKEEAPDICNREGLHMQELPQKVLGIPTLRQRPPDGNTH